jgi:hypothetical protein
MKGIIMREARVTVPELALIGGTRAALGAGLGLLLADRLSHEQRRAVGWTLFLIGAITTVPLALEIFAGSRSSAAARWADQPASESGAKDRLSQRSEWARS